MAAKKRKSSSLGVDKIPSQIKFFRRHNLIDRVIEVTFLDHSSSNAAEGGPLLCTVTGKISDQKDDHIVVKVWAVHTNDKETRDINDEVYTILISTMTHIIVHGYGRIHRFTSIAKY